MGSRVGIKEVWIINSAFFLFSGAPDHGVQNIDIQSQFTLPMLPQLPRTYPLILLKTLKGWEYPQRLAKDSIITVQKEGLFEWKLEVDAGQRDTPPPQGFMLYQTSAG